MIFYLFLLLNINIFEDFPKEYLDISSDWILGFEVV